MKLEELLEHLSPDIVDAIKNKDLSPLFYGYVKAIKESNRKIIKRYLPVLRAMEDDCVQLCLAWSTNSSPFKREAAMIVLGEISDQSTREYILTRLEDSNSYVRQAAVRAIDSREDASAFDQIMPLTEDPEPHVREAAVTTLKKLHKNIVLQYLIEIALEPLNLDLVDTIEDRDLTPLLELESNIKTLKERDLDITKRYSAVLRVLEDDCLPICLAWATNANPFKREAAMMALARIGDLSYRLPILACLKDNNIDVRQAALRAFTSREDNGTFDQIVPLTEDSDPHIREAAVTALGKLHDLGTMQYLIKIGENEIDTVRVAALKSLGTIGNGGAVRTLLKSLNDPDDRIKIAAITALGEIGEMCIFQPIIDALEKNNSAVEEPLDEAFALTDVKAVIDPLVDLLKHGPAKVRKAAAHALGEIGVAAAIEPLTEALTDNTSIANEAVLSKSLDEETRKAINVAIQKIVKIQSGEFIMPSKPRKVTREEGLV